MAGKYSRVNVGSVVKAKNADQMDYIKVNPQAREALIEALQNMDEKAGMFLNLESRESQLVGLEMAVENGKISPENAAKARERIENIPDFVRFQVVLVQK